MIVPWWVIWSTQTMADDLFGDRLLVIDDEPAFAQVIKKVAQDCGFEVAVTADPSVFMNAVRLWHPTVIMLDLKMPNTDGIQLLRALAADQCTAHVVVTSGEHGKILDSAMQLGRERGLNMRDVLPKPVRAQELRERLCGLKRIPKLRLSADLAHAIAADELFLEYQPKLDCRLARITGVEALVRWHAANLSLDVAVNISARDLEDIELPDRLEQHCQTAGLDPGFMTLELTETSAMREAVQMMDVLTRLRLKGFSISIDDFGTGYSSLVQLQKLPFSEIKIDQSFVMQMLVNRGCKGIVEIVIDLAKKLGLTSVAEGVEEEAALNSLREMGCDMAQGFYLCRPMAASRIADFVRERGPGRGAAAA